MKQELEIRPWNGLLLLFSNLGLYAASVALGWISIADLARHAPGGFGGFGLGAAIVLVMFSVFVSIGFFIVNPNEAKALVLFGVYKGTAKENGFFWANPFMVKTRVSLKARNLNGDKLKVNDRAGNPIEIAAVVVWRVKDTFQALFDVDSYEHYVSTQSEAAIRHLAGSYPYDAQIEEDEHDDSQLSLRAGRELVNAELESQLRERLGRAGVEVIEARLSHLAYAPEIAAAMLQRQQATAVVAARSKIVDGAVGMVRMALDRLAADGVVELDPERRAAMVTNLMVVLCGDKAAQPIVNAGTLYT